MSSSKPYLSKIKAPTRAEVDALPGLTLLEFGTNWCGHCCAAQPALAEVLSHHAQWHHLKVEDGPGYTLGAPHANSRHFSRIGCCVITRWNGLFAGGGTHPTKFRYSSQRAVES